MLRPRTLLILLVFVAFFLFSFTSVTFAHEGHDHSEKSPTISTTQEQASSEAKVLQTTTNKVEQTQSATPLWIPVVAVVGGIVVGIVGIALLHTHVLHPKAKE